MGGGRDFSGNRRYRRVGGKYERIRPYKRDLLKAVQNAENIDQLKTALENIGLEGKTDFLNDKDINFRNMKQVSTALSEMVMQYGSDMFGGIEFPEDDVEILGEKSGNRIYLNKFWFSRESEYQPDTTGFHPPNFDLGSVVKHEYAHLLHDKLGRLDPDVKDAIREYETFKANYEEMNTRTNGLLNQYAELFEKWRMTTPTKVKTRGKLVTQMDSIREKVLSQFGLDDSGLEEFKKFINLGQNSEKLIDVIGTMNAEKAVRKVFQSVGASSPVDVAIKLTGKNDAYASKNWYEAHAECVADYMTNGKNASPISIAYVREMNKYFRK